MIIENPQALAAYAYFAREGKAFTLPGAGVTAANAMPDADDASVIQLGVFKGFEQLVSENKIDIEGPSQTDQGIIVRTDQLSLKQMFGWKLTSNKLTAIALGIMMRTDDELTAASTVFRKGSGTPPYGWFYLYLYNHKKQLYYSENSWGVLRCTNGLKGGGDAVTEPEFEFAELDNALNTASGTP
jgi:hypothetical protein